MMAAAPADCAVNIACCLLATYAIAWWRFRRTSTCWGNCFSIVFRRDAGWQGTASATCFLRRLPMSRAIFRARCAWRHKCWPSAANSVTLEAELEERTIVRGETNISRSRNRMRRVRLVPRRVRPLPDVLEAIREADLVLVGPRSRFTSIIPNLLVEQVSETILHSRAVCVY